MQWSGFASPVLLLLLLLLLLLGTGSSAFEADDFLVRGLEDIYPQFSHFHGDMYAGLLPIDDVNVVAPEDVRGELMFWLFQPHKPVASDTLTIWFNGGPVRSRRIQKKRDRGSSFKAENTFFLIRRHFLLLWDTRVVLPFKQVSFLNAAP
jgi:hypothetical protein